MPPSSKPLHGCRVLVTGAAKRIGHAIALTLAGAGADVAITYNRSADEARQTVLELEQQGVRACAIACDLHAPAGIAAAVETAAQWGQGLDVLINNAGAFESAALEQITPEQWDAMFSSNTRAPWLAAQAALPWLRSSPRGGRIVNVGSLGGMHPWAMHGHYCASKAALHMLSQTMAKAWAPEIAVNCIAPGMIVIEADESKRYEHFIEKTPMRRNGTAEDVAELALFLSSASMFLTGQVIAVDGGLGL